MWTEQYLANGVKIKTSYEYYPNNLMWKITDHKGNTTEYKYDNQKRLTKVIYPDDSTLEYTYTEKTEGDKKYNMIIDTQRNGSVVTTIFDELNRVKTRSIEPGPGVEGVTLESFGYDGLSRLTHAENDYSTLDMKYDPLNRLIEEKQNGKVVVYSYSVENNLRKMTMTYPNQRIIEKDFDILDRLSKIKQGQENIADYSYIGRSYQVLSQQFGNGDAVSYLYDQGRRLTRKETKNKNSDLINKYNYGYNKVHMKKYEQRGHDSNKGDIFAYDGIYRLTGIKFNSPQPTNPASEQFEKQKTITFDKLSNILSIVENQDGQDKTITTEIPADSNYSKLNQYERFDQWGITYDLNGNLTQKGTQHYIHDYRNRIVNATDTNSTVNFKYDALGRRIQKDITIGSQSKTTNFYYSGHQVIEERDSSDKVIRQLVYGNGIDEVIRVDKFNGTTSPQYYIHRNEIGSTTAVTDANGDIIERVYYDIYGMPTFKDASGNVIPKSSISNSILFQGREYDPELNLYYYRARYYDPIMGRFLSTDPMGYADSMNLYQAFGMNPINFSDPYGLEPVKEYAGVVADIINAMNKSPSKIGNKRGKQAIQALLYLGETELIIKGVIPKIEPANTPYFNTKKGRYIYTKKGGWIDMSHFLFYAGRAYYYKIEKEKAKAIEKSSDFILLPWYIRESIYSKANIDPGGEALQESFIQERMDSIFAPHSAYSYEDLPSDKYGIIFALHYFDPQSHLTLAEQISNFLINILGATVPTAAPNWNNMPIKDTKDPPTQTNKTTSPIYTSEDVKKLNQFLKWLESFIK